MNAQIPDERRVEMWMREFAASSLPDSKTLDPGFIWWKGELLRRYEAQRQTTKPLEIGERACLGVGVAALLAFGVYLLRGGMSSGLIITVVIGMLVILTFGGLIVHATRDS